MHFNYYKFNQYLIKWSLFLMTALTTESIDRTNFKKNALGNSSHILYNTWNSASALDGCVVTLRSFCFIAPQTFPIGLRSGLWAGLFIVVMILEYRYADTNLVVSSTIVSLENNLTQSSAILWRKRFNILLQNVNIFVLVEISIVVYKRSPSTCWKRTLTWT